jgi:formamidopyrimidine-DNA glycosylase
MAVKIGVFRGGLNHFHHKVMPELPEVETVRTGLENALKGSVITKVTLRRADLRIPFPDHLVPALKGRTINAVRRRAKYLLFDLDSTDVLIAHLGMTGRFSVEPARPRRFAAHDHCIFDLSDKRCVIYNDARRFGLITLCKRDVLQTHPLFAHLGPEPLAPDFTAAYLKQALEKRKTSIKQALMDQEVVVGVGNIYASEALFFAGIDPRNPASKAASQSAKLIVAIRTVLEAALASGGSSLKDFLHVSGDSGYFQHQFKVYDRKLKPCFTCKTAISQIRQGGRSSFFCSQCQK